MDNKMVSKILVGMSTTEIQFSIRVKELFEPIIFTKEKKKGDGFWSFLKHFLEKPIFE